MATCMKVLQSLVLFGAIVLAMGVMNNAFNVVSYEGTIVSMEDTEVSSPLASERGASGITYQAVSIRLDTYPESFPVPAASPELDGLTIGDSVTVQSRYFSLDGRRYFWLKN